MTLAEPEAITWGERRELADRFFDHWEGVLVSDLGRFFRRQESVALARLKGPKARKHTRHWQVASADHDPSRPIKIIDVDRIFDGSRWDRELRGAMESLFTRVFEDVGAGLMEAFSVDALFNLRNPEAQRALDRRVTKIVGINETTASEIRAALQAGEVAGDSIEGLQRRVRHVFSRASTLRARTIARTEVVGATNEANYVAAHQTGLALYKQWLAATDARTRVSHQRADGQIVAMDGTFNVGGVSMLYPHDPSAPAREVIMCRCTTVYTTEPPAVALGDTAPPVAQREREHRKHGPGGTTYSGVDWDEPVPAKGGPTALEAFMHRKWGTMADGTPRRFNLKAFKSEPARLYAETLDDLFKKYPKPAERIRVVGTLRDADYRGSAYGVANADGRLGISASYYSDVDKVAATRAKEKAQGFKSTADVRATIAHEFGHHVEFMAQVRRSLELGRMRPLDGPMDWYGRRPAWIRNAPIEHRDELIEVAAEATGYSVEGRSLGAFKDELSRYGTKNVDEFCAESWAEMYCEGDNARPVSKAVSKRLQEILDELPELPDALPAAAVT